MGGTLEPALEPCCVQVQERRARQGGEAAPGECGGQTEVLWKPGKYFCEEGA